MGPSSSLRNTSRYPVSLPRLDAKSCQHCPRRGIKRGLQCRLGWMGSIHLYVLASVFSIKGVRGYIRSGLSIGLRARFGITNLWKLLYKSSCSCPLFFHGLNILPFRAVDLLFYTSTNGPVYRLVALQQVQPATTQALVLQQRQ